MTDEEILLEEKIEALCERDSRYKPEAYNFVLAALTYTLTRVGEVRHVTGRELLEGLRELCLESFGPMSKEVLNHWGVRECSDVGHVVFNLVDEGLLRKTETDSLKDFEDGFDFEEEFINNYEW